MSEHPKIAARFARDTKDHVMTVLHEEGLYRHLRFSAPRSFCAFDLITWANNFVIRWDGMAFVFSVFPTEDLFELFRRTGRIGEINPSYWQEKIIAGRDQIEDYSDDLFRAEVESTVQQWTEGLSKEEAAALREAVDEHFFSDMSEYNVTDFESEAQRALLDFQHGEHYKAVCVCGLSAKFEYRFEATSWRDRHLGNPGAGHGGKEPVTVEHDGGFQFYDTHEWRLRDYSWRFLWACHAIRWGIAQYDAAKAAAKAVES
ncbi:hypothetical protein ACIPY6_28440 [Streptomyces sp. NPDC090054]|uniref:hypothetical protein n=1 Tax=Streptomyces sp. NPDC090054 TaxID=3365933 RepID=UPI0037FB891C